MKRAAKRQQEVGTLIWRDEITQPPIFISDSLQALLGIELEPYLSGEQDFWSLVHLQERSDLKAQLSAALKDLSPSILDPKTYRFLSHKNTYRYLTLSAQFQRSQAHTLMSVTLSNEVQTLPSIERYERLQLAFEATGDCLWDWDLRNQSLYISKSGELMLGYSQNELANFTQVLDIVHAQDTQRVKSLLDEHLSELSEPFQIEVRLKCGECGEGYYHWVLMRGQAHYDMHGKPIRMIGLFKDIHQRKEQMGVLEVKERRYHAMFEANQAMMLQIEPLSGKIIDANLKAQKFYGYSSQELQQKTIHELRYSPVGEADPNETGQQKPGHLLCQHRLKSGEVRTVELYLSPIETDQGLMTFAIAHDVTKAKANEIALLESNRRLESLALRVPGLLYIFEMNAEGHSRLPFLSEQSYAIFGCQPEEVAQDANLAFSRVWDEDFGELQETIAVSFAEQSLWQHQFRVKHPDKGVIWLKGIAQPEMQANGWMRWYGYIVDATAEIAAEQAVLDDKFYFESLLKYAADAIHILDPKGQVVECSHSFARQLGYSYEEAKALRVHDWDVKFEPEAIISTIDKVIDDSNTNVFETQHRKKDGSVIDVQLHVNGIEVNGERYLFASARDITESNALKHAIEAEQKFISAMVDNANAIIAVIQADGTMTRLNKYGQVMTGYTQEQVMSEPYFWLRFLPEEIKDSVKNVFEGFKQHNSYRTYRNVWISKEGNQRLFEWSNTMVEQADGEPYVLSVGVDISDAEQNRLDFKTIFERSENALVLLDEQGKIKTYNPAFAHLFKQSSSGLVGYAFESLYLSSEQRSFAQVQRLIQINGQTDQLVQSYQTPSGQTLCLQSTFIQMPDQSHILVLIQDITEAVELRQSLVEQQNQFRQEIAALNLEKAKLRYIASTSLRGVIGIHNILLHSAMDDYYKAYLNSANATLKALSKECFEVAVLDALDQSRLVHLQMPTLIQRARHLLENDARAKGIVFKVSLGEALDQTFVVNEALINHLLNILLRQVLTMTPRGEIHLSVSQPKLVNQQALITFTLTYTGEGLSEEQIQSISTASEQGVSDELIGFRLAVGVMEKLGGYLSFKSTQGQGAEVSFSLTLQRVEPAESQDSSNQPQVLLVGGSDFDITLSAQVLKRLSLQVIQVSSGAEAMQQIQNHAYDLIMIDLQLPDKDAYQTSKAIDELGIKVPMAALSAEPNSSVFAHQNELFVARLQKPLSVESITPVLRRYLPNLFTQPTLTRLAAPVDESGLAGIDLQVLQANVSEPQRLAALLQLFRTHLNEFSQLSLPALTDAKGMAAFKEQTHRIKGNAANMQAKELFKQLRSFDQATDEVHRQALFAQIIETVRGLSEAIEVYLQQHPIVVKTYASEHYSKLSIMQMIEQVLAILNQSGFVADTMLNQLLEMLSDKVPDSTLQSLEQALNDFDYGQAQRLLKEIKEEFYV